MRVPAFFSVTIPIDGEPVVFRIKRMTFEEYAWFDAAFKAHSSEGVTEDSARAFVVEAFERFITVESELIDVHADGSEHAITSGTAFLQAFGRYAMVVQDLLSKIYLENILDEEKKRALRSRAASLDSSTGPSAPGPRPETTAVPAGDEDSVRTAGATPTTLDALSGLTEMSPLVAVPSAS